MLEYLEYIIVQYFGNSLSNVLWWAEMRFKITGATTGSMYWWPVASPHSVNCLMRFLLSSLPHRTFTLFTFWLTVYEYCVCLWTHWQATHIHAVDTLTGYIWTCSAHTDKQAWLFLQSNSRSYDWVHTGVASDVIADVATSYSAKFSPGNLISIVFGSISLEFPYTAAQNQVLCNINLNLSKFQSGFGTEEKTERARSVRQLATCRNLEIDMEHPKFITVT